MIRAAQPPQNDETGSASAGPVPLPRTAPRPVKKARPKWIGQTLKVIRRVHLYTGLVLLPFVLFFGVSGVLFNHPGIGRDIEAREISPAELAQLAGMQAWDTEALAQQVVDRLNADAPGRYTLDPAEPGRIFGPTVFMGRQPDGTGVSVAFQLGDGLATVSERNLEGGPPAPPFAGDTVELDGHSVATAQQSANRLLASLGYDAKLRPHPRPAAQLRFRVQDTDGKAWNVSWDTATGQLDGRDANASRGPLVELSDSLHKRHHYPKTFGVAWLWALFADITGITMVVWALTGMVMWWQLKPTRLIGVFALIAALVGGGVIFSGMADEIGFNGYGKRGP